MKGKVASTGYGIGEAVVVEKETLKADKEHCEDVNTCIDAFREAIEKSTEELRTIREKSTESLGEEHAAIFDAHIEMANDVEIKQQVESKIENDGVKAAYAFQEVTEQFIEMFENMEDDYFAARAADIKDIQQRVLGHLLDKPVKDLSLLDSASIIVARDLAPSDTAGLNIEHVRGFVTEAGGTTSHTAIIARALGIPALVGVEGALENVEEKDTLLLDAHEGELHVNPDEKTLADAKEKIRAQEAERERLKPFAKKKTETANGKAMPLYANIGTPKELIATNEHGAEGIGLFRTEFLFMDTASMPDEGTQLEAYKEVFDTIQPVIVRTLDIGGDKALPYLEMPEEANPFLGHRAVRLTLSEPELFNTQLRALLRAAKDQKELRIMFPMIATVEELKRAKESLARAESELEKEGKDYQRNVKVGIMIEIPAAALNARALGKHCDFFSIGTNDLIQYVYAADRMNEHVAYLYRPLDPVLLSLIKDVTDAAQETDTEIGVCGEMAGDFDAALILFGLGLDELSMSPARILPIREALSRLRLEQLSTLADDALKADGPEEVRRIVQAFKDKHLNT